MTSQNQLLQLAPLLLIFVLFYVLMIVPMRKRQKALQQMIENLKKGDRVITSGGLYGEVAAIVGAAVVLKIADNVKVKIAKSAITGLEPEAEKGGNP
ncbi:MAG TPA: preprotein translocase subunit YajC [Thermoanaerobaculia bacterium]|jgi:preprotein translocase subunit YajC|nr:preprotein translocase subunit YajC [Thermoanaerobaculia bacterium]